MANRIHNLLTKYGDRDGRMVPIMIIGLDVDDLDDVDAFMTQVGAAFRSQRLISPRQTRAMFVTLTGDLTAEEFKRRWAEQGERDPVLGFIMGRMEEASVLHGDRDGTVIEHLSLIDGGGPEGARRDARVPQDGRRHRVGPPPLPLRVAR